MRQVMIISDSTPSADAFPELLDILLLLTAIVSTFISLLIPCLFYLRKECRSHPQVLIANISLLESVANFNIVLMAINIFTFENFLNIKRIFHLLTFDLVHLASTDENTDFCVYNYEMYLLVELLSISCHICYSVDLFLTIKFPFFAGSKRRKFYYAFSLLLPTLTLAVSWEEAIEICSHELVSGSIYKVPFWFLVTLVVFCGISIAIVGMSFLQQRSEAKIRRDYIKHHRIILSLLVLLWVAPIWTNILIQTGQDETALFDLLNKTSFFCIVSSTGIICVARMTFDQFLRQRIRRMLCHWGRGEQAEGEGREGGKGKIKSEAWNLPLSGAMNEFHSQEIVHNIIQVVSEACTANQTLIGSQVCENRLHDCSLSSTNSHNTIVVEEEHESENAFSRMFLRRQEIRYDHLDPHECTVDELKEVCKRKRRFQMVCIPPQEEERLGTKTVHLASKIVHEEEEAKKMLNIKVTEYSHRVFRTLRNYDNLTPERIAETLDLTRNIQSIRQAKESLGASGSFFFFSYDHRIVIKTISEEEKDRCLGLLPYYFDHIRYNEESLFARTYGIFAIEIAGVSKIYFLMMENTFCELQRAGVEYRVYDLKGSTVQRQVTDPRARVFKDINYFKSADCFLLLSADSKARLVEQLERDVGMLRRHNIMDYSLLLGVGRSQLAVRRRELYGRGVRRRGAEGFRCVRELEEVTRRVYSVSLIDYLQEFNLSKKMELWLKRIFKGGGNISSIGADPYYRRFMQFVNRVVVVCNVKFRSEADESTTI